MVHFRKQAKIYAASLRMEMKYQTERICLALKIGSLKSLTFYFLINWCQ